jgi:hypothetical protein
MVWFVRALGWLLFGCGALIFIATGGFRAVGERSILTMAGGVMMPVGMLLTAACTLVANWRAMHPRPEEMRERVEAHRVNAPPGKQYKARPLAEEKLSPSPGPEPASKEPDGPPSPPAPRD